MAIFSLPRRLPRTNFAWHQAMLSQCWKCSRLILPPVRYKGVTYVRRGPRKAIANPAEEALLVERRVAAARTFDAQACIGATLDDLALELFTNIYRPQAVDAQAIAENHRSINVQLASLRFFDLGRECPQTQA